MSRWLVFLLAVASRAWDGARREEVLGDLHEAHARRRERNGRSQADLACLFDALSVVLARPARALRPRAWSTAARVVVVLALGLSGLVVADGLDALAGVLVLAVLLEGAFWAFLLQGVVDGHRRRR